MFHATQAIDHDLDTLLPPRIINRDNVLIVIIGLIVVDRLPQRRIVLEWRPRGSIDEDAIHVL